MGVPRAQAVRQELCTTGFQSRLGSTTPDRCTHVRFCPKAARRQTLRPPKKSPDGGSRCRRCLWAALHVPSVP